MALGECMPVDLFGDGNMIDLVTPPDEDQGKIYESKYILDTLREVNEDDTLSRVLSSDISIPDTCALSTDASSKSPIDKFSKLNEEVTLCAGSSHVESVMSECISDGIEATDIGSLLEQFLEYEKAISPALSPAVSAFPTPVPSPGNEIELVEECIMTDMMGQPLIGKSLGLEDQIVCQPAEIAEASKPNDTQKDSPIIEVADFDIVVDNQVTISTSPEEVEKPTHPKTIESNQNLVSITDINSDDKINNVNVKTNNDLTIKSTCKVRNKNGVVVVECSDQTSDSMDIEENKVSENDDNGNDTKTTLKSVIGKAYRIPKRQKDSRNRTRSRSPIMSSSQRSYQSENNRALGKGDRSKSRGYGTNSDDDEREERYERYRSERRTPSRKDDNRKRRKYSSCSDDEYDYYRYSKRTSGYYSDRRNRQSPIRKNYEHDYYKTSSRNHDRYHRSNSLRENGVKSWSARRENRPRKQNNDMSDDDNVHERMAELATPVPYDIEQERKIGFLCQERGPKASLERRNVYAGGINRRISKVDLIRRFDMFGPIEKVTLHFRETGDSYAFIVFEDPKDAVRAVQEGNDDPNYDKLDLCFGGRRKFVGGSYVDFDANTSYLEENDIASTQPSNPVEDESEFDLLLKMARRQQTS